MCFMLAIRSVFFRTVNDYFFFSFLFKKQYCSRREGRSEVGKTERDRDRQRQRERDCRSRGDIRPNTGVMKMQILPFDPPLTW